MSSGHAGLPPVSWGVADAFRGLVIALLLGVVVAPIVVVVFDPGFETVGGRLLAQLLLSIALVGVATVVVRSTSMGGPAAATRLGLRAFRPSAFGWALVALLAYYAVAIAYSVFLVEPKQQDIARDLGLDQGTLATVAAGVMIVGVAPFAEEVFFRGFLFAGFRSKMGLWPAAIISAAIFGLIHLPTGATTVIPLAALGLILAWLYEKTGTLWMPILIHLTNNGLAFAVAAST